MASRTLSFQQLVLEADPKWQQEKQRQKWYYFSNGKTFDWDSQIYTRIGP